MDLRRRDVESKQECAISAKRYIDAGCVAARLRLILKFAKHRCNAQSPGGRDVLRNDISGSGTSAFSDPYFTSDCAEQVISSIGTSNTAIRVENELTPTEASYEETEGRRDSLLQAQAWTRTCIRRINSEQNWQE